ncbi:MAG TPA: hypothetical protein VGN17_00805 [Bryobacteraceae bacterium]|jgi:hypothetical protein
MRTAKNTPARPVSLRRKLRQRGQEILEFGLVAILMIPLLLGAFITGMNLVRSIQANQMSRDLTDMFIHGQDFSLYVSQNLAKRLAQGMNLGIGTDPGTARWNNTASTNGGNGIVVLTKIMYVGTTSEAQCAYVSPSTCNNHDSFVFMQRVQFGNSSLTPSFTSSLGALPTGITMLSDGEVQNPVTDTTAKLGTAGQTAMANLWQVNTGGQTQLADGQIVYVGEVFFQSPDLSFSSLSGNGVYARYFF